MNAARHQSWATPGDRHKTWSAILFADLVGYSRRMSEDEIGTLEFMVGCAQMIAEVGKRFGGTLVQTTGDGFLLLFDNCAEAVDFGIELHDLVARRQANETDPAFFRIGIHAGELYRTGGTIHGHAVNVAARLESEALPGTCVVSQLVRDAVAPKRGSDFFDAIGAPPLKNIAEKLQLYRTRANDQTDAETRQDCPEVSVIGGLDLRFRATSRNFAPGRMTAALFGYLVLSAGPGERQDKIAGLLAPDRPTDTQRRAFAACKQRLIAKVSPDFPAIIWQTGSRIGLNEIHFETDLNRMLNDLRRNRVDPVLVDRPDWPMQILAGFRQTNKVYATWLDVQRKSWRDTMMSALGTLLGRLSTEDETLRDAARAILVLEPGNEIASAALIAHHGARGNRVAAIEEYDRLSGHLSRLHGLKPSQKVEAARGGAIGRQPAKPAQTRATRRLLRIVVEPFATSGAANPPRVDGFRSELVANLARFREWSVVEARHDDLSTDTPTYAVGAIAAGDGHLRLTLRDLTRGGVLWADDVSLGSDNWVANQRNVVGRIAAHLETYISNDRLAHVIGANERQATTHDNWLDAERIFARWTPEATEEAEDLLRLIIREDPTFAPAYSSLASYCNVRHVVRPGSPRDAATAKEAHDMAQRAVELDPLDARNHLALAWTAGLTGAFDRAAIHLDMAATLNPNSQATLVSCAMGYAFFGQADRGEALADHALRIAPMLADYQWCYLAAVHFLSGRYEDALSAARNSGDRIIDNQGWIAATLTRLGRVPEARAAMDRLIEGVRPVWAGTDAPTAQAVFNWFTTAYPLRQEADRERLSASLQKTLPQA